MKIAIVGAGYAGLALAYFAQERGLETTVFEAAEGASTVSTGLLHPAPGRRALPNIRAKEGMEASLALLQEASGKRPVFEQSGILRFVEGSQEPQWIAEGITVYSRLYLQELRKLSDQVRFQKKTISHLDELKEFDVSVVSAGAGTAALCDLEVKRTIGQALLCKTPKKLEHAFLGGCHITPTEDPTLCQVGSTYEHGDAPDPKEAEKLLDKAALIYPPAKDFTIVEIRSGVRIAPLVGYMPIVRKIGPGRFVFTAFGSRGLLYHALLAKELIDQL